MDNYEVGRGFGFYRRSAEEKIKEYTYAQIVMLLIIIACIITREGVGSALTVGISTIIICAKRKRKLKLHSPIDEIILFELEERKIINPQEVVKAVYKDFEGWSNIKQGGKILIITIDRLIEIIFNDTNEFKKIECSMSDIVGVGITDIAFSIRTKDNEVFHIELREESYQDSHEEFLSLFLKELDSTILQRKKTNDFEFKDTNEMTKVIESVQVEKEENINDIKLDLDNSAVSTENKKITENKTRYIDL